MGPSETWRQSIWKSLQTFRVINGGDLMSKRYRVVRLYASWACFMYFYAAFNYILQPAGISLWRHIRHGLTGHRYIAYVSVKFGNFSETDFLRYATHSLCLERANIGRIMKLMELTENTRMAFCLKPSNAGTFFYMASPFVQIIFHFRRSVAYRAVFCHRIRVGRTETLLKPAK